MTIHTSGENVMTSNRNRLNDIPQENLKTIAYLSLNGVSTSFSEKEDISVNVNCKRKKIKTVHNVLTLRKTNNNGLRIENVDIYDTNVNLKEVIEEHTNGYNDSDKLKIDYIDDYLKYSYMLKYLMRVDYNRYSVLYKQWTKPNEDKTKYLELLTSAIKQQELIDGQNYLTSPLISDFIKSERTKYKRYIYQLRRINTLMKDL